MKTFGEQLEIYRQHLGDARENLELLGLSEAIAPLEATAGREEFRISVLGRFKHGKSSVVNALLGDAVSPVDLLPCTSALIEFRFGEERSYRRWHHGMTTNSNQEEFAQSAGNAAKARGATEERWRIELPIRWLGPGLVLVDTPGSDEDPERLELANKELERADAALVVLRADQLFSLDDMELAEELQARLGCVIIVINRIDRVPAHQQDRVIGRAKELAARIGVPPERVLPLSAVRALSGEPEATSRLEELRGTISRVMLADVGGARLLSLLQRTRFFLEEIRPDMDATVGLARRRFQQAEVWREKRAEVLDTYQDMKEDIRRILTRQGERASRNAQSLMREEWPSILQELKRQQSGWDSEENPLFNPKGFATDIAEDAQSNLESLVLESIPGKLRPVIERRMSSAQVRLHTILVALSSAGFGTLEELQSQLNTSVVEKSFGTSMDEINEESITGLAVTASVSTVVGYIVADIVLFYLLGTIGGFLNPLLLATAVTVGIATYLVAGKAAVKEWIRGNIADKMAEKLGEAEVTQKIAEAAGQATLEQFGRFSDEYLRQLDLIIKGAQKSFDQASYSADQERVRHLATVESMERAREAIENMARALEDEIADVQNSRAES